MNQFLIQINDGLYWSGRTYTKKTPAKSGELPKKELVLKPFDKALKVTTLEHAMKIKARLLEEFEEIQSISIIQFDSLC